MWAITRSIEHRGPDEQDIWQSADVSLGSVRLKIIDLEAGQQPMAYGSTVLVFNGEVYNHAELRRELEALGHRFTSRSDTEVVLHAFVEWDVASFQKLRGMFAAAFWQQDEKRLVLVRDRMGIKPLYLAVHHHELLFGSEMKAILLHPEFERHLNLQALDRYLMSNYVTGTDTLVEGIHKLAPGHWLEFHDGHVEIQPYWNLEFRPDAAMKLGDAKQELDGLLKSAVQDHLISDAPLGIWLSGGLDSSAILHYAAAASSQQLKTFSVSFQGRSFDESRYFREVAEKYSTEHHEFDLNPERDLASVIEEFATYSDEPSADAGALPVWFLSKMCRKEVTVALSGDGADELFGGYKTYIADRYAERLRLLPLGLRKTAARAASLVPVSDDKIGLDYKLSRMLNGALLDPVDAHFYWNGTFNAQERRELVPLGEPADKISLPGDPNIGGLNRFLFLDQISYLPDDILVKCDRMSMAHSLEVRPPFLDHRVVEFAARLPENFKIRGRAFGSDLKFILRDLMRDKLPRAVTTRRKEGFDIPAHHWLRTILRGLVEATLNEDAARESGVFNWPVINRMLGMHMQRRANFGYHIWGLLILFLWMKRWKIQPPKQDRAATEESFAVIS